MHKNRVHDIYMPKTVLSTDKAKSITCVKELEKAKGVFVPKRLLVSYWAQALYILAAHVTKT